MGVQKETEVERCSLSVHFPIGVVHIGEQKRRLGSKSIFWIAWFGSRFGFLGAM